MPQTIEVPGFGDVEFPDGMSDAEITAAIQKNMVPAAAPQPAPSMGGAFNPIAMRFGGMARSAAAELPENVGDIQSPGKMAAAIPESAANIGSGLFSSIGGGLAGLVSAPFVGMDKAADITRGTQEKFT